MKLLFFVEKMLSVAVRFAVFAFIHGLLMNFTVSVFSFSLLSLEIS
jgi:hypothetical protein